MQQNGEMPDVAIREQWRLGQAISYDYAAGNLLVIGVLKGHCLMADLIRVIDVPLVVDATGFFLWFGASSSGQIVRAATRPWRCLDMMSLVEDIIDSGLPCNGWYTILWNWGQDPSKSAFLLIRRNAAPIRFRLTIAVFPSRKDFWWDMDLILMSVIGVCRQSVI